MKNPSFTRLLMPLALAALRLAAAPAQAQKKLEIAGNFSR